MNVYLETVSKRKKIVINWNDSVALKKNNLLFTIMCRLECKNEKM
jgi:hypothetical protein